MYSFKYKSILVSSIWCTSIVIVIIYLIIIITNYVTSNNILIRLKKSNSTHLSRSTTLIPLYPHLSYSTPTYSTLPHISHIPLYPTHHSVPLLSHSTQSNIQTRTKQIRTKITNTLIDYIDSICYLRDTLTSINNPIKSKSGPRS